MSIKYHTSASEVSTIRVKLKYPCLERTGETAHGPKAFIFACESSQTTGK